MGGVRPLTVVFARYRQGLCSEAERICHVLLVPRSSGVPHTLVALCGQDFPPGVLEMMPQWAGMPCVACTLLLPEDSGSEVGAAPAIAEGPGGGAVPEGYIGGAAFSGEALRHLVPASTQRCRSLGRTVAVSECGHLAYDDDDLAAPEEWPVCTECADRAAGSGTALWQMPRQRPGASSADGASELGDGV